MTTITHADIATRAYHLWESEGRLHGQDERHWLQAERDLAHVPARKRARPLAIPARDATVVEAPAKPKRSRAAVKATPSEATPKTRAPRRRASPVATL